MYGNNMRTLVGFHFAIKSIGQSVCSKRHVRMWYKSVKKEYAMWTNAWYYMRHTHMYSYCTSVHVYIPLHPHIIVGQWWNLINRHQYSWIMVKYWLIMVKWWNEGWYQLIIMSPGWSWSIYVMMLSSGRPSIECCNGAMNMELVYLPSGMVNSGPALGPPPKQSEC